MWLMDSGIGQAINHCEYDVVQIHISIAVVIMFWTREHCPFIIIVENQGGEY